VVGFARCGPRYYGSAVMHPAFRVPVADLKRGPVTVTWTVPRGWLARALEGSEATPTADGSLSVQLSTNGSDVVVRGRARVSVTMPCAVTLEPVPLSLEPDIFLLLAPALDSETIDLAGRPAKRGCRTGSASRPRGKDQDRRGRSKHRGWADDPMLSTEDAAQDRYDGEQVVLDGFLREFILLELPMNVRRSDLPNGEDAAIAPPSPADRASPTTEKPVDPRLAPLAALASRLRQDKE